MHIRAKESRDALDCLRLFLAVHDEDGYPRYLPADPAAFVAPSHETTSWVAEEAGHIVGQVALHQSFLDPTLRAAERATGLPPEGLAVVARLLVAPKMRWAGLVWKLLAPRRRNTRQRTDSGPSSTSSKMRRRRSHSMKRPDGRVSKVPLHSVDSRPARNRRAG